MFKNLLLILVLIPFLCFAQYEWTDKGDYKYIKYDKGYNCLYYSLSGDSIFVSGNNKLAIFDDLGNVIEDTVFASKYYYNNSISSDRRTYTINLTSEDSYNKYFYINIYSFETGELVKIDTLVYHLQDIPYNGSVNIGIVEYNYIDSLLYIPTSSSSSIKHGNYSGSSRSDSYKFSYNMHYLFKYYHYESFAYYDYEHITEEMDKYSLIDINDSTILNEYKFSIYTDNYSNDTSKTGVGYSKVAFSNDERFVACYRNNYIDIYNLPGFTLYKSIYTPYAIETMEFAYTSKHLFIINGRNLLAIEIDTQQLYRLLNINELKECKLAPHPNDINKISLVSDDKFFIVNTNFDTLNVPDFTTKKTLYQNIDTVQFVNQSRGLDLQYKWDFGDGYFSEESDPKHQYQDTGTYSIKLISFNKTSVDTIIKDDYIKIIDEQLFADFEYSLIDSIFPIGISLNDISTGNYNYSKWMINGNVIKENAKNHIYLPSKPGVYVVSLFISDTSLGFYDIVSDTISIDMNRDSIDNVVNERILFSHKGLNTNNIINIDNNYYVNFVYDSIIGENSLASSLVSFDKKFNVKNQKIFTGYYYPPFDPVVHKGNLLFRYDAKLDFNEISALYTDLIGNTLFDYSHIFDVNTVNYEIENKINTQRIQVFEDKVQFLTIQNYNLVVYQTDDIYSLNLDTLLFLNQNRHYDPNIFIQNEKLVVSYINNSRTYYGEIDNLYEFTFRTYNKNILSKNYIVKSKIEKRIKDSYYFDNSMIYITEKKINIINLNNGKIDFTFTLPDSSAANKIHLKGDSLYIAGSYEYEAAFYIYNFKTGEIDSVILENRIGELTDLCFNEKGNLVLFGKLNNYPDDYLYIAEYDFDLTDNSKDSLVVDPPSEPKDTSDISGSVEYYPNPATEELLIKYMSEDNEPIEIHVLDMTGRKFFAATINAVNGENDYYLQIDHIAPGVYLLNIKTPSGIISRKFVKE